VLRLLELLQRLLLLLDGSIVLRVHVIQLRAQALHLLCLLL
jgi:hypothetical protein